MKIITTDNNCGRCAVSHDSLSDLRHIADCPLSQLTDKECNDVWMFPNAESRYDDMIDNENLISLSESRLTTGNIMGFIGYGDTELTIRSRFTHGNDGHDWFMQYMLQKVFAINIFNLKHAISTQGSLDIAALLLPYFLHKALNQGIYREYVRCHYNDSRVRGAIDFNAHIRNNYPFKNGKVSYSTKEYKYDNSITQLVRHTIEFLRSQRDTFEVLYSNPETQDNIKRIIEATPSYSKGDRMRVINANLKPKIHPFYSEYRPLQKLCLQILKREKLGYGDSTNRIYGVLFDGAWLWEEYLNIALSSVGFKHPKNKTGEGFIFPFKGRPNKYKRFPDFMKDKVVADAKYKYQLTSSESTNRIHDNIQRDDLYQMISYIHITGADTGLFISPTNIVCFDDQDGEQISEKDILMKTECLQICNVGTLNGYGGGIIIIGVNIPKYDMTYAEFESLMQMREQALKESLLRLLN